MTHRTDRIMEVMQAFLDGKSIEVRAISYGARPWECADCCPAWDWGVYDYRVKREPMVVWVNILYGTQGGKTYRTEEDAKANCSGNARQVRFVEDIS